MKRILITAAGFWLLPLVSLAQAQPVGALTVITTPPGAEVSLAGDANLAGISPITFTYPILGEYELVIRKLGFEEYRTNLLLDPQKPQQVLVELSPKTAAKAAVRSMVIPGWGQRYCGHKTRSIVFGVLFLGSAVALLDTHNEFKDREGTYLMRLAEYDRALVRGGTISELSALHAELASAQADAYDAEDDRRVAAFAMIGVWGLNVIDAFLSAPGERATFSIKGVGVEPAAYDDGFRVTFSRAF
ncbi:MAG: DUF5683 domain-containing protein [Candidatus Zixiibacteriota bacterium]